jgi:hypothetical protein
MNGILCDSCTENQQKIIQLLQAFDSDPRFDHSKQYSMYSNKIESRYPLCATCSYRVSVQLKKCAEAASLQERRQNGSRIGGDWRNKLQLAQKMRWKHTKRKIAKKMFFWPDFLFQVYLIAMCVFKRFDSCESSRTMTIFASSDWNLIFWLPDNNSLFKFSSFFFITCLVLFLIQFNGIALNRRGVSSLAPQMLLLILRAFIGNCLYRSEETRPIGLNLAVIFSSIGLALIYTIGSKNCEPNRTNFKQIPSISDEFKTSPQEFNAEFTSPMNDKKNKPSNSNGFAAYSESQHRFHSFANQGEKSVMPWPDKPLPGRLSTPPVFTFDENAFNRGNESSEFKGIKSTRLVSDDPFELEPMFSSFSLGDPVPNQRRSKIVQSTPLSPHISKRESIVKNDQSNLLSKPKQNTSSSVNVNYYNHIVGLFYNCLLTSFLVVGRLILMSQTPLIAVILAGSFGLRGFLWPRLSFKFQLAALSISLSRLAWLAAELSGCFSRITPSLTYLALTLDLILIVLR